MAEVSALRLVIIIGASFQDQITWKDANGVLVPLPPGTSAEATVRPSLYDDDVLIRFSTSPSAEEGVLTLIDPGVTQFNLTTAQTVILSPITDAVFDIKYTFSPTDVRVKLHNGQGLVDIRMPSTRP